MVRLFGWRLSSIGSSGKEDTKSVSSRAGSVTRPSLATDAPTQQLTARSRLVAASLSRPRSVASSTLPSTGSVLLDGTTRPTMLRPSSRLLFRHDSFIRPLLRTLPGERPGVRVALPRAPLAPPFEFTVANARGGRACGVPQASITGARTGNTRQRSAASGGRRAPPAGCSIEQYRKAGRVAAPQRPRKPG